MAKRVITWALPGVVFTVGFAFSACLSSQGNPSDGCPTDPGTAGGGGGIGTGGAGGEGTTSSSSSTGSGPGPVGSDDVGGVDGNNFHHPEDPASAGQKNPFEILKERAEEGPPEVRTRLHSCSRIPYTAIGAFLASRGVNMVPQMPVNDPPTAAQLYAAAGDSLGAARYDVRQGEASFYTVAAATKLFDIFVQAAPEIIANIESAPACQLSAGVGKPMFDEVTGKCVYNSLSCIMGRPATDDDMELCNLMIAQADPNKPGDLANKQKITVAAFLSAAHTCE